MLSEIARNAKLYSKAKIHYSEPKIYMGVRPNEWCANDYKTKNFGVATTQQAAAAEPVEAVPVQVVTQAPARSKWIYIAIGAAVAWLIFGRR